MYSRVHRYTSSSSAAQPVTSTAKVFTSLYTCVMLHHHHHHQLSLFLCSVNTYSVASLSGLKTNFTSRVLSVFLAPHCLHLATFEMWCWSGGRWILTQLSLCYSIVYYYNGAQRYEQFLQVGWLDWALILLGLVLCLCIFGLHGAVYILKNVDTFFPLLFSEQSLVWLTRDLLWHCVGWSSDS